MTVQIVVAAAALFGGVLAAHATGAGDPPRLPASAQSEFVAQSDAPAAAPEQAQKFDCYAATPRSGWYDAGDYARAFAEIEPLAHAGCAAAEHLLAVMYAKGQGVRQDPVSAYAWLLASFSLGVTPFGGPQPAALGDDPDEFEIVEYAARLSDDQIAEAESMVPRFISPHAISANGAVGPTGVRDTIVELRQRRANYRLNGKLATLATGNPVASQLAVKGTVVGQLVTPDNSDSVPHQLLFVEAKVKERRGRADDADGLQREFDLAASEGERFQNLALGTDVKILRFGFNAGFASQVEPVAGEPAGQKYWVDNCVLKMKEPQDDALLRAARDNQCERHGE